MEALAGVAQTEASDIRDAVKLGAPDLENYQRVGNWVQRDIDWLNEIQNLQQLMPGTDRVIVRSFQLGTKMTDGIGTIKIEGRARTASDVELLGRRLNRRRLPGTTGQARTDTARCRVSGGIRVYADNPGATGNSAKAILIPVVRIWHEVKRSSQSK